MLKQTRHEDLVIYTSDDPEQRTRAVVEDGGRYTLVETLEATYTENEGAAYNPEQFLETVTDYYRQGRGQPIESPQAGLGEGG
ncbi:hypothetical protein DAETH_33490 (plasmid) [Deinococcus aetherius]|uniref:Uncharacterized protein n=1 Tax=Deinococcus aetherius TaxID=200252 RepID=A0ABM8AHU8_9DEIO|nr:hypothetical protein [Deinococcus aetherius]BDP43380.1 hypothetical protein DAETH_33490 [Deinococcus aetherius]